MAQRFDEAVKTMLSTHTAMWSVTPDGADLAVWVIVERAADADPTDAPWGVWCNLDYYPADAVPEEAKQYLYKRCALGAEVLNYDDETLKRLWKGEKLKDVFGSLRQPPLKAIRERALNERKNADLLISDEVRDPDVLARLEAHAASLNLKLLRARGVTMANLAIGFGALDHIATGLAAKPEDDMGTSGEPVSGVMIMARRIDSPPN